MVLIGWTAKLELQDGTTEQVEVCIEFTMTD